VPDTRDCCPDGEREAFARHCVNAGKSLVRVHAFQIRQQAGAKRSSFTMTLSKVEHALGMMRIYLVERATQGDWTDGHEELAQTILACLRQTDEAHRKVPEGDPKLAHDVLRRALRFVNDNLDSKLKWDEIARDVGVNPFIFGRRFKATTGITLHQYIIRCRLRKAMRLLSHDELTLADIALEVGCSCQSHLTALFRKHLGTTPGAFRILASEPRRRGSHFRSAVTGDASTRGMMQARRSVLAEARVQP